jgi:hypothetical protein
VKDLYKHLALAESCTEADIRAALASADATTRAAAESILLDPKRREVYDRNRRVLVTVGRLRSRLGLNLTRFWPRSRFADFTVSLTPNVPVDTGSRVDPMAVAWAFGVKPPRAEGERRLGRVAIAVVAVVVLILLAVALILLRP